MQLDLKNITKKQLFSYLTILVVIISLLVFGSIMSLSNYELLYQVSNNSEMPLIIQFLNKTGENYKIQDKKILVQSEDLRRLRMSLAAENIISNNSIIGYEIFNKPDMLGSSSFTQNINLIRSLEGELSRTIMSFNNVQIARVHLVIPKREIFSNVQGKPTASVMLKLIGNHELGNKQIIAIANLIASAVPNLDQNNVTIVSSEGKPYKISRGENEENPSYFQEYKLEVEKHLKHSVEDLIENLVGIGKVKAEVTAEIDFDKLIVDSEKYNPDEQVLRSEQSVADISEENDKNNNVSVDSGAGGDQGNNKTSNSQHSEEIKNFEISKETKRYIKEIGTIKKLSMAVIVDGSYVKDEKTGAVSYQKIPDEELKKLRNLIASAVGLDTERGDVLEVINMNFSRNEETLEKFDQSFFQALIQENLISLIKTLIISLVVLLSLFFIIKPAINRILNEQKAKREAEKSLNQAKDGESQQKPNPTDELIKRLEEFITTGNNTIVEVLRNLMMKN